MMTELNKTLIPLMVALLQVSPFALADQSFWNGTVLGFEAPQPGLLGNMLGIRPILTENGFTYNLGYLTQSAYNASGGYDHNGRVAFIDQLALMFNQDLERWTGIPDARIEGNIVNRNHNDDLTSRRLQDTRVNETDLAQESYGGQSITRLGWLTFARSFDDRRLTWRIGMMNKNQTFDQIVPCDFQTLALCGGKSAYSYTWSNWNVHTWGTTFEYKLRPELTLKSGVIEYNTERSSRRHAWSWSTKGSKGVLLPVELEARTHVYGLPGAYNLGVLFTNARRADLYTADSDKNYNRTWFVWGGLNQQLAQQAGDPNRGLSASFNFSVADQRSVALHSVIAASLRYRGLFDARPEDWIGLGVSYMDVSDHYARNQAYLNQVNGVSDYNNPLYSPVPGHAVNAEFYYRFAPVPWLSLQPGLQYWHRPGGLKETQDAWVVGLKTIVAF
ncbi:MULTISPECIES: carbohydrate porin [Enterobacteriaceae]|uniref:carbohydrate porin n=1 Tax=Enterobacteriaceae TaxID=543 RepID=UPI0006A59118|nr:MULTISPECIES: carbohydrate porin [Enterobacteriaceae]MCD9354841.1 carbohydrate porin [Klebsiella pneumoniae]MCM7781887.1 carbohydrate porin [Enterobacter ludwigii]MDV0977415.1 carbohydrate porin [Klebsiella pneumoniae]